MITQVRAATPRKAGSQVGLIFQIASIRHSSSHQLDVFTRDFPFHERKDTAGDR
jgi:hypothetical protein